MKKNLLGLLLIFSTISFADAKGMNQKIEKELNSKIKVLEKIYQEKELFEKETKNNKDFSKTILNAKKLEEDIYNYFSRNNLAEAYYFLNFETSFEELINEENKRPLAEKYRNFIFEIEELVKSCKFLQIQKIKKLQMSNIIKELDEYKLLIEDLNQEELKNLKIDFKYYNEFLNSLYSEEIFKEKLGSFFEKEVNFSDLEKLTEEYDAIYNKIFWFL